MKTKLLILSATLGFVISPALCAEGPHDHGHGHSHAKKTAGPNGGRVITSVKPRLEFFVTPGRKVKITFLGEDGQAIAPADQVVTAVGGDRSKPARLVFSKADGSLISDKPLPEGNMIPIVLQIKIAPGAKTVNEKFMVNLADCSECDHKEYACTCEH